MVSDDPSQPTRRAQAAEHETVWRAGAKIAVVAIALFGSGAAGLMNQVVWQRSLKVFLGGSETICSTIVVLVFMAGLGVGSVWMGRHARRLTRPLVTFAVLEVILGIVNFAVCALLMVSAADVVFAIQRGATTLGVPLLLLYAFMASIMLCVPCFIMGTTLPVASEVCQRTLGLRNPRLIGMLFFANTFGSVAGALASSGWMIARLGLASSLQIAAGINLCVGLLLFAASFSLRSALPEQSGQATGEAERTADPRHAVLAFGLGFCALAFEMYLLRIFPLRHLPLPFTFASVVAGFLAFWSLGAALSASRRGPQIGSALRWCALLCLATVPLFVFDSPMQVTGAASMLRFLVAKSAYFLPCLLFGYLFSRVTASAAQHWGEDVGRIYGWNTLGCCCGVVGTTFVGYELPFFVLIAVLAMLLLAMREYWDASSSQSFSRGRYRVTLAAAVGIVASGMFVDLSRLWPDGRMYSGRDGVVIVKENGDMIWDGLWHSSLSRERDHIGSHNWYLAVAPVLAHCSGKIPDVCVIGLGTGITAATLADEASVERVVAYDISHVLKEVLAEYPAGTLHVADNPKIEIRWQDARSGLALDSRRYDVIQAQPLYLEQAGSGLLNSAEFMQLVRSRLKPDGIFCLYSNGTPEQAFAVRETADSVFENRESFFDGYLLVLSQRPIDIDAEQLAEQLTRTGKFWDDLRSFPLTSTPERLLRLFDGQRLASGDGRLIVTDDRPRIEYPHHLAAQVRQADYPFALPEPVSGKKLGHPAPRLEPVYDSGDARELAGGRTTADLREGL